MGCANLEKAEELTRIRVRGENRVVEIVNGGGMGRGGETLQYELLAIVHRQHTRALGQVPAPREKHAYGNVLRKLYGHYMG